MNNGLLDIHLNHDLAHCLIVTKKKPAMDHEQTQQRQQTLWPNLWPADRKLPDNAAPGRAINVPENNLLYRQWSSTVSMVY